MIHPLCCDCLECMGGVRCSAGGVVRDTVRQQRKIGHGHGNALASLTPEGRRIERLERMRRAAQKRRRQERTAA